MSRLAVLEPEPVQGPPMRALPRNSVRRWLTVGLGLLGAALMMASLTQGWWNFHMVAPQYPKGLDLVIRLTGVTGDSREINIINHYIGMGHLDEAAVWERTHALPAIALAAGSVILLILGAGKRVTYAALAPAVLLPLGFLADTWYWLYRFGHDLDPKAAIHIAGFTPALFGHGKIGQFQTWAWPGAGFWMAIAGAGVILLAVVARWSVCRTCPHAHSCGLTCPHAMIGASRDAA